MNRVPHLRDGFIVAKWVHLRGSENPDTLKLTLAARPPNGTVRQHHSHFRNCSRKYFSPKENS
jgi:hypothetical protein